MKKKPLITFRNITKTYQTGPVIYQALKGVDLTINEGDFIAIMGSSGSGKSTMMNIMGALDLATSGEYYLRDRLIDNYDEDELSEIRNQEIGFVFQSFNLLPRTTVFKNVERPMMYAGVPKNKRKKRVMESLKMVGLEDKVNNMSNHISGGQIQRVAIARALVMNPSIILADEPTGNLDSKTAYEIMNFFKRLNKRGHTIILITHEEDIASFAKKRIILKDGLVKEEKENG